MGKASIETTCFSRAIAISTTSLNCTGDSLPHYDIKDNVVLESNIREKFKKSIINFKSVDERLAELNKQVAWTEFGNNLAKYFIMSKHPKLYSDFDFRKYLRTEFERINSGMQKLGKLVEEHGGTLIKNEDGYWRIDYRNITEDEKAKLLQLKEEESLPLFHLSYFERENTEKIKDAIQGYLGEH